MCGSEAPVLDFVDCGVDQPFGLARVLTEAVSLQTRSACMHVVEAQGPVQRTGPNMHNHTIMFDT